MSQDTFIHQFQLGPWDNFIYFIGDKQTRECAVVDPAWHAPSILDQAKRLDVRITRILCTHSHFDHVNRVDELLETHDVPVHMLRHEVEFSGFRCENLLPGKPGDTIRIGPNTHITLVHTPGHTPGSVSYQVNGSLITGDTLFVNGCGRCDFVGGDPEVMYQTLKTLTEKLPGTTVMYPGHNYGNTPTSTLTEQLETNPYLQLKTLRDFIEHRMSGKVPNSKLPEAPEWTPA